MSKEGQALSEVPRSKSPESSTVSSNSSSESVSNRLQSDSYDTSSSSTDFSTTNDAFTKSSDIDSKEDLSKSFSSDSAVSKEHGDTNRIDFSTQSDKSVLNDTGRQSPGEIASKEFRNVMDVVRRHGSMNPLEQSKRAFPDLQKLSTPSDAGLDSQTISNNETNQVYSPRQRSDRLSTFSRRTDQKNEEVTRRYSDRNDGLKMERYLRGPEKQEYARFSDSSKNPEHVSAEIFTKNSTGESFEKAFDSELRTDGLKLHKWEKDGGKETQLKVYSGRSDGLISDEYFQDSSTVSRKRNFEQGKAADGLLSQSEVRFLGKPDTNIQLNTFDQLRNSKNMSSEKIVTEGDKQTVSRTYANRADKLKSETETVSNEGQSLERLFDDGSKLETTSSNDGEIQLTKVHDASGRILSINGQDKIGKYVASELPDGKDRTLSQRTYTDGAVVTSYPPGETGPYGASEIIDRPGQAPQFFDAEGKELPFKSDKSVAVSERFNENGTVFRRMSNGSSKIHSLNDYVRNSTPQDLAGKSSELVKLAGHTDSIISNSAVSGLFKATAADTAIPGEQSVSHRAILKLARDPEIGGVVQDLASNNLASPDLQTRRASSEVLGARVSSWDASDIDAITKNPSNELAFVFSKLPASDLKSYKTPITEGIREQAKFDAPESRETSDQRIASIAVAASVGGAESLTALGYNVVEKGNKSSIETKGGTKISFDQTEGNSLMLRNAIRPGKVGADSESLNYDDSTGELSSVAKADPYGQFTETVIPNTEHGDISQRKYSESKLVRTIFGDKSNLTLGQPAEVQHLEGRAPVSIDAQGNKTTSPTNTANPLATSFEDPGNPKTIFSDGNILSRPLDSYVATAEAPELAKHQTRFENLAESKDDSVSSASIDALVKLYTSGNSEVSDSSKQSLRRLSEKGGSKPVTESILKAVTGRQQLTRESNTSNKAVTMIAGIAGYDGLEHAGLTVDRSANSAKLNDGTTFNFEESLDNGLRLKGYKASSGGRQIDFRYDKNGKFEGSTEKITISDSAKPANLKYENMKLPPLKKGWGPYQALEQARSEGKIDISNKEMKVVAERIRDREFAKLGRNYFKVGESFDMYSADELKQKGKEAGSDISIHRDKNGRLTGLDRSNETSVKVKWENDKPTRISDGLGPDLVSADGKNWGPDGAPEAMPKFEGKLGYDKKSGALTISGKQGIIGIEPDGSRIHTSPDGKKTILFKPKPVSDKPQETRDGSDAPGTSDKQSSGEPIVREFSDRSKFFRSQNDSTSCSAFAMAMMASDHITGKPVSTKKANDFKDLAGTNSHGYRGTLDKMAGQIGTLGLNTKAYRYDEFGKEGMADLNRELDKGHTAVARVINDRTGNRHYIYIAGRNSKGDYIVGDPDRKNKNNKGPVSPERLMKLMSSRKPDGGFVAGWGKAKSAASSIEGTAAHKMEHAAEKVEPAKKDDSAGGLEVISSHTAKSSGYFPYNDSMEGGHFDRKGKRLRTLQDYLSGKADYVSVAMDSTVAPYGSRIRIPELEQKYGREIEFRLVDTGRAFKRKGTSKIDICVKTRRDTYDESINGKLTVQFVRPGKPKSPESSATDKPKEVKEQTEDDALKGKVKQVRLKGGLKPVVVLDAGHGGHDTGATVRGAKESTIVNDLTGRVAKHLEAMGIVTQRSNPKGGFKALSNRSSFANRALDETQGRKPGDKHMADAFVSIHANHDGANYKGGGKARGFQTYYSRAKGVKGTDQLAKSIHSQVTDAGRDGKLDVKDSGIKSNKNFHVIRETKPPSVLLETGYMTNDRDRANLEDSKYREKLAKQIAQGIAKYLDGREPRTL